MAFAPAVKQEIACAMVCETASREHSGKQKTLISVVSILKTIAS